MRFVGDSLSMQHARSFSCFLEPTCAASVDHWGVAVPGEACYSKGAGGNGWLVDAEKLLLAARFDKQTVGALLSFVRSHSGIHQQAEFCSCAGVSRHVPHLARAP